MEDAIATAIGNLEAYVMERKAMNSPATTTPTIGGVTPPPRHHSQTTQTAWIRDLVDTAKDNPNEWVMAEIQSTTDLKAAALKYVAEMFVEIRREWMSSDDMPEGFVGIGSGYRWFIRWNA